jgi:co-chaperonin GroES (HSP10)
MKQLKFKRTEVLVEDVWSDQKEDKFKVNSNRFEGKIINCGESCQLYKVGQTILFEKKAPQVVSFEYEGKKYLYMDEKSIICEVI